MHKRLTFLLVVSILTSNLLKLQAAITDTVPPDSDMNLAAVPGIPGKPGQPGPYGPLGQKGEIGLPGPSGDGGETGAVGEQGEPGNPGPIEEDGMRVPGMMGPRDPPGLAGATGGIGLKGEKGNRGDVPANPTYKVAFTMQRITNFHARSKIRLPFDLILTVALGTHINLKTGTFTCSIPGTYVFMFSLTKFGGNPLHLDLRKNGEFLARAYSILSSDYEQVASSALVVLKKNDEVYLTVRGKVLGYSGTFSGFLLYE